MRPIPQAMNMENIIVLKVTLNGTERNPYERFGLQQNPFPQIAKTELYAQDMAINSLGGQPLDSIDDIRTRLNPRLFSDEFVNLCCEKFVKGEMVTFTVRIANMRHIDP